MRSLDSSAAFQNRVDVEIAMVIDPYLYPDSDVLQNLLGIRQKDRLNTLIHGAADQALKNAVSLPLASNFDGLALLHKVLFGSIFSWAGEFRTTALASMTGVHAATRAFVSEGASSMTRNNNNSNSNENPIHRRRNGSNHHKLVTL